MKIALEGEMEVHLQEASLEEGGNRRNGVGSKTVKSGSGSFELEVPRDRNGSFEPQIIKKRQTVLNEELDNKILALYGLGSSYEQIASHLQEIYGVEVSPATISSVTDKLMPLRNSLKYVASKNQKEFMVDLKTVYQPQFRISSKAVARVEDRATL
jgi:transposase-like protein